MNFDSHPPYPLAFQGLSLPREYQDIVYDGERALEFYLASTDGPGLCPLLLTAYLIELNNTMLAGYARAKDIPYACSAFTLPYHSKTFHTIPYRSI